MYKIKKSDLKGNIEDFPIEIVKKMAEYQEKQRGEVDLQELQIHLLCSFNWIATEEGYVFWRQVLWFNDYKLFFEKYPKKRFFHNILKRLHLKR